MERLIQQAKGLANTLRANAKGFFEGLTLTLRDSADAKTHHKVASISGKRNSLQTLPNEIWYTLGRVLKTPYQHPTKCCVVGCFSNYIKALYPTKSRTLPNQFW